jgi:hypothetical protein
MYTRKPIHIDTYVHTYIHTHTSTREYVKYMYTTTRGASPGNLKQAEGRNPQTQPGEGQGRTATQNSGTGHQQCRIGATQHRFSF